MEYDLVLVLTVQKRPIQEKLTDEYLGTFIPKVYLSECLKSDGYFVYIVTLVSVRRSTKFLLK